MKLWLFIASYKDKIQKYCIIQESKIIYEMGLNRNAKHNIILKKYTTSKISCLNLKSV